MEARESSFLSQEQGLRRRGFQEDVYGLSALWLYVHSAGPVRLVKVRPKGKKFIFHESDSLQDHLSFTANTKTFFLGANLQITLEISVRSMMWTTSVLRDEWYS